MHVLELPEFQWGMEYWEHHDLREYYFRVLVKLYMAANNPRDVIEMFPLAVQSFTTAGYDPLSTYINRTYETGRWNTAIDILMLHHLSEAGYRGYLSDVLRPVIARYCPYDYGDHGFLKLTS